MIEAFGVIICVLCASISALCALFCRKTSTCMGKALTKLMKALNTDLKG